MSDSDDRCKDDKSLTTNLIPSKVVSKDENNMRPLLFQLLHLPEALLCLTTTKKKQKGDGCYFHPSSGFVHHQTEVKGWMWVGWTDRENPVTDLSGEREWTRQGKCLAWFRSETEFHIAITNG